MDDQLGMFRATLTVLRNQGHIDGHAHALLETAVHSLGLAFEDALEDLRIDMMTDDQPE